MPNLDEYYPFDPGFGASANAARWGKMASLFSPDGIVFGYLNSLNATISGGSITIQTGAVMVHGYYGEIQTAQTYALGGTSGMVVAAVNLTTEVMSTYYRDGIVDQSGLTQSATLWEIPLYLITGTATMLDKRAAVTLSRGMSTAASVGVGSYTTLTSGTPVQFNIGTFNFTHPGTALFTWQAQFQITNPAQFVDVIWYGTYQYGLGDAAGSIAYEWSWPGASGSTGPYRTVLTIAWPIPVTPGRKTVGLHVSPTGPGTSAIANIMASAVVIGSLSNA